MGLAEGGGVPPRHGTEPMKLPRANGSRPTGTVATTVLVEVSITETLLSALLATYARGLHGNDKVMRTRAITFIIAPSAFRWGKLIYLVVAFP